MLFPADFLHIVDFRLHGSLLLCQIIRQQVDVANAGVICLDFDSCVPILKLCADIFAIQVAVLLQEVTSCRVVHLDVGLVDSNHVLVFDQKYVNKRFTSIEVELWRRLQFLLLVANKLTFFALVQNNETFVLKYSHHRGVYNQS